MATLPTPPAPSEQEAPEAPVEGQAGYTIELRVAGDGKLSVSVEPDAVEAEEGADPMAANDEAPAEDAEEAQSVPNIREAIKVILDIYKNAGAIAEPGAEAADMQSGYGE